MDVAGRVDSPTSNELGGGVSPHEGCPPTKACVAFQVNLQPTARDGAATLARSLRWAVSIILRASCWDEQGEASDNAKHPRFRYWWEGTCCRIGGPVTDV